MSLLAVKYNRNTKQRLQRGVERGNNKSAPSLIAKWRRVGIELQMYEALEE
jgi:hypothetical protein